MNDKGNKKAITLILNQIFRTWYQNNWPPMRQIRSLSLFVRFFWTMTQRLLWLDLFQIHAELQFISIHLVWKNTPTHTHTHILKTQMCKQRHTHTFTQVYKFTYTVTYTDTYTMHAWTKVNIAGLEQRIECYITMQFCCARLDILGLRWSLSLSHSWSDVSELPEKQDCNQHVTCIEPDRNG